MAEITRERSGEIVRCVFEVLDDQPDGSLQVQQVVAEVERRLVLTDFEQSHYPNRPGVRRFDKIIRFATIGAVKAGWMTKSKAGVWALTDEGRAAYEKFSDPAEFMRETHRLYRVWKKSQPDSDTLEDLDEDDSDDVAAQATLDEANEAAWAQIEHYLRTMPPYEFQDLCAGLLKAMGYHISWVAPPGPDRGIDVVAYTDPLGAEGPRIKVQVKRRNDKIGVDGLRSFMAVLSEHDVGIFISIGGFTPDALAEARAQENRRITLIDLERLFELWVGHYDKLDEVDRQRLPLQPVYFLTPED
jgi:restriction system protein